VNKPKLIILRGNSGCGKSTIAKILREKFAKERLLPETMSPDKIVEQIFTDAQKANQNLFY